MTLIDHARILELHDLQTLEARQALRHTLRKMVLRKHDLLQTGQASKEVEHLRLDLLHGAESADVEVGEERHTRDDLTSRAPQILGSARWEPCDEVKDVLMHKECGERECERVPLEGVQMGENVKAGAGASDVVKDTRIGVGRAGADADAEASDAEGVAGEPSPIGWFWRSCE
jgi:hypothetical protein